MKVLENVNQYVSVDFPPSFRSHFVSVTVDCDEVVADVMARQHWNAFEYDREQNLTMDVKNARRPEGPNTSVYSPRAWYGDILVL